MIFLRTLAVIGVALTSSSVVSQETKPFFIAPITTDLHRAVVSDSRDVYAVVNCDALVADGQMDLSPLNSEDFNTAVAEVGTEGTKIKLICRYHLGEKPLLDGKLRGEIESALVSRFRVADHVDVRAVETRTTISWQDALSVVTEFDEPANAREPGFEDDFVRVFPVRTRLSKFVIGEADCFVEIIPTIDGRMKRLSKQLQQSIRKGVKSHELTNKRRLFFALTSTAAGRELVESLFSPLQPAKASDASPALALAMELGFDTIRYQHSPTGGAPESLLGKKAPAFTLSRLDSDKLDMHSFIEGRPTLITFWGLACGPCRRKAPHLTRMLKKYQSEGFAVVAVNSYNDERESVASYAESEGLAHPIVLMGKKVAEKDYKVGAHPTTFWVDRGGIVRDYEIGFHSAEDLERRIEQLLEGASSEQNE